MSKSNKKSARKFISLILGISVVFTQLNTNLLGSAMAGWGINPKPQASQQLPQNLILKTTPYQPLSLKGLKVYTDNPLKFDFLLDEGNTSLSEEELKTEAKKLIEYFLACLTLPEDELWVNLSPYEKDKIIPEETGLTEMGKGLLEQDYLLKKLTASLMYPETELGKEFWQRVYQRAYQLFKTTKLPVNTFNKVWIIPDKAVVYEDGDRVVIGENHLKVMLESDYLALKNSPQTKTKLNQEDTKEINDFSSAIVKEVIIPAIEEEVNSGQNFATLRQMYSSFILATWFKKRLKQSLLGQAYVDKKKVSGIDTNSPSLKESIYQQYLSSYKDGIYNYIKSDYSTYERKNIKRRYYSGGIVAKFAREDGFVIRPDVSDLVRKTVRGVKYIAAVVLSLIKISRPPQRFVLHDRYKGEGTKEVIIVGEIHGLSDTIRFLEEIVQDGDTIFIERLPVSEKLRKALEEKRDFTGIEKNKGVTVKEVDGFEAAEELSKLLSKKAEVRSSGDQKRMDDINKEIKELNKRRDRAFVDKIVTHSGKRVILVVGGEHIIGGSQIKPILLKELKERKISYTAYLDDNSVRAVIGMREDMERFTANSPITTKGGIDFLDEKFFKLDTQGKGMDISYEPARLQDFDISGLTIGEIVIVNPKKN